MKKSINIILILISIIGLSVIVFGLLYKSNIASPSKNEEIKIFTVEEGSSYLGIANDLKKQNLIKSEFFYKVYLKIHKPDFKLEPGEYKLKESYNLKDLLKALANGTNKRETITVTFREGLHMRKYAKIIVENFDITEESVFEIQKNEEYLDSLIRDYWFFTDEIKNEKIYYALEGYLYPNTYEFYEDSTLEEIFEILLTETKKQLDLIKENIKESEYTVHEYLTLASIVELEASSEEDRKGVAGVFINRLNDNWPLGSDVTTYYAEKLDMYERDLTQAELNEVNEYNTRSSEMAGKLPISPICNPSHSSIIAVAEYKKSDYFYFVADKNSKTYFSKTYSEHNKTIEQLKEQGLWFEH